MNKEEQDNASTKHGFDPMNADTRLCANEQNSDTLLTPSVDHEPVTGAETARDAALDMIRELRGTKCRCGSEKNPGFTFCYVCFKSLPPMYQKGLYQRMGSGYEEAYGMAVRYLQAAGAI